MLVEIVFSAWRLWAAQNDPPMIALHPTGSDTRAPIHGLRTHGHCVEAYLDIISVHGKLGGRAWGECKQLSAEMKPSV